MKRISLFLLLIIFLSSVGEAAVILKENKINIVQRRTTLAISIEVNPTTGYTWQLFRPLERSIVRILSREYKRQSGLVGAGGIETWRFQTVGKGKTIIKLKYVRPWEKDVKPIKTLSYAIEVR